MKVNFVFRLYLLSLQSQLEFRVRTIISTVKPQNHLLISCVDLIAATGVEAGKLDVNFLVPVAHLSVLSLAD